MLVDKELLVRWCERLESEVDKQGEGVLTQLNEDGSECDCCLGVLCKVANLPRAVQGGTVYYYDQDRQGGSSTSLPSYWASEQGLFNEFVLPADAVRKAYADFTDVDRRVVRPSFMSFVGRDFEGNRVKTVLATSLNDDYHWPFPMIARVIRYAYDLGVPDAG